MVKKIISGGQTGADYAGLVAAKVLGIETGGTAPAGYKTENGPNYELRDYFGLSAFGTYPERTETNILNSDMTLVLGLADTKDFSEGGTLLTQRLCFRLNKPFILGRLSIDNILIPDPVIQEFILKNSVNTLNIAGPRLSKSPLVFGYGILYLITNLKHTNQIIK